MQWDKQTHDAYLFGAIFATQVTSCILKAVTFYAKELKITAM